MRYHGSGGQSQQYHVADCCSLGEKKLVKQVSVYYDVNICVCLREKKTGNAARRHGDKTGCKLSYNSCTVADLELSAAICVTPPAMWPQSVKQGPTHWASCLALLGFSDSFGWTGLASVLHFTSLGCPSGVSPERPKNTSHTPIKRVFPSLVSLW